MLEVNKIYCMDNVKGMKLLDDESIDLAITSPPYDNLRTYNGYSWDFEAVACELFRITKKGGVVVWVVSDAVINGSESGSSFRQALFFHEIGFNIHQTMIWSKPGFNSVGYLQTRYPRTFEYMFVFSKGKPNIFNPITDRKNKWGGHARTGTKRKPDGSFKTISNYGKPLADYGPRFNVWEMNSCRQAEDNFAHPAPFPEQLASDHIISWSNEGDTVLDPFMGSGTTAKMAILNRRNFIGFEISQEYVNLANKRIKPYQDQTSIFDFLGTETEEHHISEPPQ